MQNRGRTSIKNQRRALDETFSLIWLLIRLSLKITELCSFLVLPSYTEQVWNHLKQGLVLTVMYPTFPDPRTHSISIHWFPKVHGYPYGYLWFLDVSLQFSMQVWISTLISKQGYPCKDILQWMSVEYEYPRMDIHVLWISVFSYPCFYWYSFGYQLISMDIHAWTLYGFSILGCSDSTTEGEQKGWTLNFFNLHRVVIMKAAFWKSFNDVGMRVTRPVC